MTSLELASFLILSFKALHKSDPVAQLLARTNKSLQRLKFKCKFLKFFIKFSFFRVAVPLWRERWSWTRLNSPRIPKPSKRSYSQVTFDFFIKFAFFQEMTRFSMMTFLQGNLHLNLTNFLKHKNCFHLFLFFTKVHKLQYCKLQRSAKGLLSFQSQKQSTHLQLFVHSSLWIQIFVKQEERNWFYFWAVRTRNLRFLTIFKIKQ